MKLLFVALALLAATAYAQEAEVAAPKETAGSATQSALNALQGGLKEHNEYYNKAVAICKEELPAAQKIVDQAEDAQLYKERTESKERLAGALRTRVAQLTKFLKKLKKIRSKLYSHIERVNTIFQKKFLENSHNMAAAAKLLHDMGIIKVVPYNPKFNPIKNFAKFDPSTMSLIQLSIHRSERNLALQQMEMEAKLALANSDSKSCEKASGAAFEIFKLALRLNNEMYDRFEQERTVLRKFRLGLREMIEKREKKLAALTKQLAALEKALADNSHPFRELRKNMAGHVSVLKKSCDKFPVEQKTIADQYTKTIDLVQKDMAKPAGTGAATGGSF